MLCSPHERCIWMKKIYEDRPIGQIIWPATHNSATNKIGINFITRPFGQHQTQSIYSQLRNGVRVLDIRVQQDRRVCNGNFLSYSMTEVIKDIHKFMSETQYEIIILQIRTERGYTDPPDFESYLVQELGELLIKQNDHVFSKTISQVLPKRIICIWKPKNSPKPSEGGPIWSASYLRGDEFETELPLTKFKANLINLSEQLPASERHYFYKVEHILTPQVSSVEWMLMWPWHAKVVSKRINEFARLFLSKCNSKDILDRLQIYSTDFINDDFIAACISLNHSIDKKEHKERMEMIMQKHRQDLEELEKKFEDEKVQMEATKKSILIEKETLMGELGDARKQLEKMIETRAEQDRDAVEQAQKFQDVRMAERRAQLEKDEAQEAARTSETQMYELRDQLQQSKNALEGANIKHAAELAKIQAEYMKETFSTSDNNGEKVIFWLDTLGKKCYMIAASEQQECFIGNISINILSPETRYEAYLVFKFPTNYHSSNYAVTTLVGNTTRISHMEPQNTTDWHANPKQREDGWLEIWLGGYSPKGGEQSNEILKMSFGPLNKTVLIVRGIEIRPNNSLYWSIM